MHNNFYFLRPLAPRLDEVLQGFTLVSCFTQNKDELVVEFNNAARSFFVKANLQPDFCCLSFPKTFQRARKNNIDLFLPLLMKQVKQVRVFDNDRSFAILFGDNQSLVFKMHGNRANILRTEGDLVKEIFRNHLKADLEINLSTLPKEIDWSYEAFVKNESRVFQLYFTFGKRVEEYLNGKGYADASTESKWRLLQQVLRELDTPGYYLAQGKSGYYITMLKTGSIEKEYNDPIEAVTDFYSTYVQRHAFVREKSRVLTLLQTRERADKAFIEKTEKRFAELNSDTHWQHWGDLLMANLHRVKQGDDHVVVENFYNNNESIAIPLKKDISAQRNAEVFYRKSKNRTIEISKLNEALEARKIDLKKTEQTITEVEAVEKLADLKKYGLLRSTASEKTERKPFHEFIVEGFKIWVGKDAESNDELSFKLGYKEDLWLHAKDVAGSHVLIKHQAGKKCPKHVIERAAELAAYNSKRKTDTLCPVTVTPRKFVRKRKGDPAGAVVVEREEVILVQPRL